MKQFFFTLLSCIPLLSAYAAEIRGRVTQVYTGEPLAFVAVLEEGTSNGVYTDIDGYFRIVTLSDSPRLVFTYLGFEPSVVTPGSAGLIQVQLTPATYRMQEVTVRAGENPADMLMRKVIANRDRNDPERNLSFTYDSYNKLVITGNADSLWSGAPAMSNSLDDAGSDSASTQMRSFFARQHLFMMESASHRSHLPPSRDQEVVMASRVSGFSNSTFTLLATQLQSFSVYGEEVNVMDIRYLSPVANAAPEKYFYELADTTYIGGDTVYTVVFRPRRNKTFKGLAGSLHINSNGWAVQHVLAAPADSLSGPVGVRFQQQYGKNAGAWFPEQLNTFLFFRNVNANGLKLAGLSHSYIRNLQLNPALDKRDFGPVVLRMDSRAAKVSDSIWTGYREHQLDLKEETTYRVLDSLGKEKNFDRLLKIAEMLSSGKLPLGKISFDLNHLLRYNEFEGFRLGGGLHTNDFLSRRFTLGGYYGYGIRDRGHKYGGDLLVWLKRSRDVYVQATYQDEVFETGGNHIEPGRGGVFNNDFYPLLINRMDRVKKTGLSLGGRAVGNLRLSAFVNRQEYAPFGNFALQILRTSEATLIIREFLTDQAGVTLRWAPGERLVAMGHREVRFPGRWPVIYARYTAGRVDELDAGGIFNRYDLVIDKTFRHPLWGDLSIRTAGGWLPSIVPGSLYYNAKGSNTVNIGEKRYIGIASPYTFETMRVNEFLHSRFAAIHIRYCLRDLLFHVKEWRPVFTVAHSMLWGSLEKNAGLSWASRQAEHGYFESGLVIDRLLASGFSVFGLGVFYRYGEYALPQQKDNIVVKFSTSFVF